MKYILLIITIILFSIIFYLQFKKDLPQGNTEKTLVNKHTKENINATTKNTPIVSDPVHVKRKSTKHEAKQSSSGDTNIEEIPYHDELSLDDNYDPNYNKVEEKLLTAEDFENFEKDSDIVNLDQIERSELVIFEEDENISRDLLSDSNYDSELNKAEHKLLSNEDFENAEIDMPRVKNNKVFIKDDDKFFNDIFPKE